MHTSTPLKSQLVTRIRPAAARHRRRHFIATCGRTLPPPAPSRLDACCFELADFDIDAQPFLDEANRHFSALPWDRYDVAAAQLAALSSAGTALRPWQRTRLAEIEGQEPLTDRIQAINALLDTCPASIRNDLRRLRPHRRRAMQKYRLARLSAGRWEITPLRDRWLTQSVDDARRRPRAFAAIRTSLAWHPQVLKLLAGVAESVYLRHPGNHELALVLHQMLTTTSGAASAEPAPEGLHQDGADYIVSALVIARDQALGGVSRVWRGRREQLVLETQLRPGEGIFQADSHSPLWHEISALITATSQPAQRMILGIDVHLTDTGKAR